MKRTHKATKLLTTSIPSWMKAPKYPFQIIRASNYPSLKYPVFKIVALPKEPEGKLSMTLKAKQNQKTKEA